MMKYTLNILAAIYIFVLSATITQGQNSKIDSLDNLISNTVTDTTRLQLIISKVIVLSSVNLDSAIDLALKTLPEIQKTEYYKGEINLRTRLIYNYAYKGNFKSASEQIRYLNDFIKPTKDSIAFADVYASTGLFYGIQSKYDSSVYFYEKAIRIFERAGVNDKLGSAYSNIAIGFSQQSNFPMALFYQQKSLELRLENNDESGLAYTYVNIANTYTNIGDIDKAESMYLKAIELAKKTQLQNVELYSYTNLSSLYIDHANWQKAYENAIKAAELGNKMGDQGIEAASLSKAARSMASLGETEIAQSIAQKSILIADSSAQPFNISQANESMGFVLKSQNKWSEAIPYYEKSFESIKDADLYTLNISQLFRELSECYEKTGAYAKALETYKQSSLISDSVRSSENVKKTTELTMKYEFDKKEQMAKARQDAKDQVTRARQLALIISLALSFLLILGAFYGYYNKRKANALLQEQKKEIEKTLQQLKNTQSQLIQSEKMASLGDLTAGIAHEIQNPLNFVNNFSEVSKDLLEEMKEALDSGHADDAKEIANDVILNLEKINHHGKRADAIVKGMLQHSRVSSGQKEPTDINVLADEYLRLAYHGLMAKDKSFTADYRTALDKTLPVVQVVPQDIGRVLLNLINNAFYACAERSRSAVNERAKKGGAGYSPLVTVSTKKLDDRIEVRVTDNGTGIPEDVKTKIFQPFFTTKPTGEGTGLGLSLSYDIITKGHGGELSLKTKKDEGSEFIISLPMNQ